MRVLASLAAQAPSAALLPGTPTLVPPPPLAPPLFAQQNDTGGQAVFPGPSLTVSPPPPADAAPSGRYYSPGFLTFIHGMLFVSLVGIAVALWVKCVCCTRCWERRRARRQAGATPRPDSLDGAESGVGLPHSSPFHLAPPARLDPTLLPFLPEEVFLPGQTSLVPPSGVKVVGTCPCAPAAQGQGAHEVGEEVGEAAQPGLSKQDQGGGQGARECPVCLCEYEGGDLVKWLPDCGHAFHSACILAWLHTRSTCPICRVQVGPALRELASQAKAAAGAGAEEGTRQQRGDEGLIPRSDAEPIAIGGSPS